MSAEPSLFDLTAGELEARTTLDALAARGTLRLALKGAGLDAKRIAPEEMAVAVERVLPHELEGRGVEDASGVCRGIAAAVRSKADGFASGEGDSPEQIFRRMRQGPATPS